MLVPEFNKKLSASLKALGMQHECVVASIVESGALLGRGMPGPDMKDEVELRCSDRVYKKTIEIDQSRLYDAVREILRDELTEKVEFEDVDRLWKRRWAWCVNGSHNKVLQREEPEFNVLKGDGRPIHRRVYAEEVDSNPLRTWSGRAYVNAQEKEELQKKRLVMAVDTNTYFNFEHLLKPIEEKWNGRRVVLDPGAGGTYGMTKRINVLGGNGGVNVMIDYEEYDTQHSLESQATVIKALCDHTGYDTDRRDKLMESFFNMKAYVRGECIGKLLGTLCSGHRGTTVINSILNLAYLLVFCPTMSTVKSVHVGDDVYVSAVTMLVAEKIMDELRDSPIRINITKQSIGRESYEFLRMCTAGKTTQGYVCRAIGGCVMAQWTSDAELDVEEAVANAVRQAWTLCNRARDTDMGKMLVPTFVRVFGGGRPMAQEILTGAASYNGGPVRLTGSRVKGYTVKYKRTKVATRNVVIKRCAIKDYLSECITTEERNFIRHYDINVHNAMVRASYAKTLGLEREKGSTVVEEISEYDNWTRSPDDLQDICFKKREGGILNKSPIFMLMKNQLDHEALCEALVSMGVPGRQVYRMLESEVYRKAWGTPREGTGWVGTVDYTTAVTYSTKARGNAIVADIQLYC